MGTELTITVPTNAAELATDQRKAEELAAALREFTIASAEEYTLADEMLSEVARKKALAVGRRKEITGPFYEGIRRVEALFRPLVTALDSCEAALKKSMGAFRVAREREEREARELAARAAESGKADTLIEALTIANEAAARPESRATTRFVWRVKECNPPAMSREFLVPDLPRLEKLAREHKGDSPPIVPGVTFERTAMIGARK